MAQHVKFKAGEVLFHQGDASDRVFQVNSGEVEILRELGSDSIVLGHVHEGEWLGEMGVMEHRQRSATARAAADGSAEVLTVEEFLERVTGDPGVARDLLIRLSIRLRTIEDKIAGDLLFPAQSRSANMLVPTGKDAVIPANATIVLTARSDLLRERIGSEAIAISHLPYVIGRVLVPEHGEREPPRQPDLLIEDHEPFRLSRDHFMVARDRDRLVVWDLGSTLGTIVNGVPIGHHFMRDAASLHNGDNRILAGGWDSPFDFDVAVSPSLG